MAIEIWYDVVVAFCTPYTAELYVFNSPSWLELNLLFSSIS